MDHTLTAVDDDLDRLDASVVEMGELAVNQTRAALDCFLRQDAAVAALVAAADAQLDDMDAEIERRAVRFIALRQPVADDLRRPIAAMKTAMQLERCGDLAKNIAKRVGRLEGGPPSPQAAALGKLGEVVADRLAAVVDAYRTRDAAGAFEVWSRDTDVDQMHETVFRDILALMASDPSAVASSSQLMFIAKNLERIGDHATNIAELVHYAVTGADLAGRPKLTAG
jgi:phosphate transport system protein